MNINVELFEQIKNVGSTLSKVELIKKMNEDEQKFVKLALDPDVTFGITADEDEAVIEWYFHNSEKDSTELNPAWTIFGNVLSELQVRSLTGIAAAKAINSALNNFSTELDLRWACRILNKELRGGFSLSLFNRAFPSNKVEKFSIQLADVYNGQELSGLWYFQPKLDGNRVVLIDGKALSRNGKEYKNCEHVIAELLELDPNFFDKWVLDGEMMGDLGFDSSSGALRRIHEKNKKKATFTYWVFDIIRKWQWDIKSTNLLSSRQEDLVGVLGQKTFKTFKIVPTESIDNPTHSQIMEFCDKYVAAGFEGAMAKAACSKYMFKRESNLLKVKKFYDVDLKVVGMHEGRPGSKYESKLGGLDLEGDGISCRCGSGFSDEMREDIWNNKDKWIGAVCQIQYQDKTKDGSLRFPVFVMRRVDKE